MALVASGDAAEVVEYFRDVNITDASKVKKESSLNV